MKLSVVHLQLLLIALSLGSTLNAALITTNNYNDPQPLFTAHYPYSFLINEHKNYLKGINKTPWRQAVNFSAMPFFQWAKFGTDALSNKNVHIGNIPGQINLLAVLPFNVLATAVPNTCPIEYTNLITDLPCGQTFPELYKQTRDDLLHDICVITGGAAPTAEPTVFRTLQGLLEVQQSSTLYAQSIGIFDNRMRYNKTGVRFNLEALIAYGFGFMFCTGIASISQIPALLDQTSSAITTEQPLLHTSPPITPEEWTSVLGTISTDVMGQVQNLARAVNLDINAFDRTSIEDIHFDLFWRGVIPVQQNPQIIPGLGYQRWSKYLAMPFASIGATIATGKSKDPDILFSLPFGNNGSNAVRARAGVCLDFYNTIELSGEIGVTHFSSQCIDNLRIPNNNYQQIFYPFGTNVTVDPGNNWHLALGMYAYNFDSIVSATIDYVFVHHGPDKIAIRNIITNGDGTTCNAAAFNTCLLSSRSSWHVHLINGGLTCAISPNARLLGIIQIPLARRNAYRSTTVGLSFEFGF